METSNGGEDGRVGKGQGHLILGEQPHELWGHPLLKFPFGCLALRRPAECWGLKAPASSLLTEDMMLE